MKHKVMNIPTKNPITELRYDDSTEVVESFPLSSVGLVAEKAIEVITFIIA